MVTQYRVISMRPCFEIFADLIICKPRAGYIFKDILKIKRLYGTRYNEAENAGTNLIESKSMH